MLPHKTETKKKKKPKTNGVFFFCFFSNFDFAKVANVKNGFFNQQVIYLHSLE
jgi:hypothetical protein